MLLLDSARTITVDGVTVFPDHADPDQFWYLPAPVQLARRGADNHANFTLISYKPAVVQAGVQGGGFLMFETMLRLTPQQEQRVRNRLSGVARGTPRLAAVPFDSGTVQCIALNLQGSGGTTASPGGPGTFNAVEKILGASIPSLHGDNNAAFSLTLSQEGAIILEQAFQQRTTPVGVIYDLKFTGMRPALKVTLVADLKRVHDYFSASLSGQYYFVKAGIEIGLEKLKQDGVISITVEDFSSASDRAEQEKWALDLFKETLLNDWFKPTLGAFQFPAADKEPETPKPETPKPETPKPEQPTGETPTPQRQPATLRMTGSEPDPAPDGYRILHTPAASGTTETITVEGGSATPTLRVNGEARPLDGSRQAQIEVGDGASVDIVVGYPASQTTATETFNLYYDFDKPREAGWGAAVLQSYVNNNPNPDDARFRTPPPNPGTTDDWRHDAEGDGDALKAWVARLAGNKQVEIDAHASFEGDSSSQQQARNMRLSDRRRQVAVAIVESAGGQVTGGTPQGQQRAQAASRRAQEQDRVAHIRGEVARTGDQAVTLRATLSRPEQVTPPIDPNKPEPKKPEPKKPEPQLPSEIPGAPEIALKLRFVHQEEQKSLTIQYNRSEAVQRTYAPQGFIGLLLDDLQDKDAHFVRVDLDDAFFRTFEVTVDAPIDFARIGLTSAQVALDYGSTDNPATLKHGDFSFDANSPQSRAFKVFMNDTHDLDYRQQVQFHFNPGAGWEGHRFSYNLPAERTSDRTLLVNPFEHFAFLGVQIVPHRIDWGIIDAIDVQLRHEGAEGVLEHTILLQRDTPQQVWNVRTTDRDARSYTYTLVHHLRDGSTRTSTPVTTQATTVLVDDPFEDALNLTFVPLFDPASVRMVFVDVEYADAANDYQRREQVQLAGDSRAPVVLRISLLNPALRTFRVRQTVIGNDNSINRGAFTDTDETIIAVG